MAYDDMNHMQHIEGVALSDCAVLQSKEATYQGSWKRAGGRSAWFMARRNMDRLLAMMPAKPVDKSISNVENIRSTLKSLKQCVHYNFAPLNQTIAPLPGSIEGTMAILEHVLDSYTADDVFARIAEKPKGEDGTVLACIRDLRRYFMLVEAEMIAEGIVENESKTYEQEHYPQDVYTMIANDKGMSRDEVKDLIRDLFYSAQGDRARSILVHGEAASPALPEPGPAIGGAFEKLDPLPLADTPSCGDGLFDTHQQRRAERVADGGSHHASLAPWWIGRGYFNTLAARVGLDLMNVFYVRKTPEVWALESIVLSHNIPRELKDCYDLVVGPEYQSRYVLKRDRVPDELAEQWPRLQIEMNQFEHETSPEVFRFMYAPNESGEKMILKAMYMAWAREN